jgi:hypothetical protein
MSSSKNKIKILWSNEMIYIGSTFSRRTLNVALSILKQFLNSTDLHSGVLE